MRPQIFFIWIFGSIFIIIISGQIAAQVLDMSVVSPVATTITAIMFSVLHPGGWFGIIGLIWALKKESLKPLLLAFLGAALTGVTVPILEGIGAMYM